MEGFSFKFPPWLNYILLSAALAMLYLITEHGWDFLVSPLLFLLGLSAAAFGIDTVLNRRTDSSGGGIAGLMRQRQYFGVAAAAYGASAILLGLILVAGAVLRQLNIWEQVWASLQANPGWLLGIVGIFLFLGSLISLVDKAGQERGAWQKISALSRRILAVLGILLAAVLIAAGLLEIFCRSGFDALLGMLQDLFLTSFDG